MVSIPTIVQEPGLKWHGNAMLIGDDIEQVCNRNKDRLANSPALYMLSLRLVRRIP